VLAVVIGTLSVIAVQNRANRLLANKNADLQASNSEHNLQRVRALAAEAETRKRAEELQKVSDFQSQMLAQLDPAQAGISLSLDVKQRFEAALDKAGMPEAERPKQLEALTNLWSRVNATDTALALIDKSILKPAALAIDKHVADQPVVNAALRETMGELYNKLGLHTAAKPLIESALATRRRALGKEHPDTLISRCWIGLVL